MFEKVEGTAQNLVGKAQDAVGGFTGDASTQLEGKARQVAGKAQQAYGETLEQLRDVAGNNPLLTLAVVALGSFVIGAIWAKPWGRRG